MRTELTIVADSGATKAAWMVSGHGGTVSFRTDGINVSHSSEALMRKVLSEAFKTVSDRFGGCAGRMWFYSAGVPGERCRSLFAEVFPDMEIHICSDLDGASHALLGNEDGIACILGTGCNSGLYRSGTLVRNIHPCGFILGDEGSAAALGRRFVADYLKGLVPEEVTGVVARGRNMDYAEVVSQVYNGPAPARYLGSFAPGIMSLYGVDPYVTAIAEENIKEFFRLYVLRYEGARSLPVCFAGSFALACKDLIAKAADLAGINVAKVSADITGPLAAYHINRR